MDIAERTTLVAVALLRYGGRHVSEADMEWLSGEAPSQPSSEELNAQAEAAFRGFFKAASEGFVFVDEREIAEHFGNGVVENYPEASLPFLNFARTYWTLRIVADAAAPLQSPAAGLVEQIEKIIGPLFFPMPGPIRIDPARREADQRSMLRQWLGADFDVNGFIGGNPILIRDRRPSPSGCLGVVAFLLLAGSWALVALRFIAA